MKLIPKIICKTIGVAGVSSILYDAYNVGRAVCINTGQSVSADTFESIVSAERTTSEVSPVTSTMQKELSKLRMDNPIVPAYGRVKGFIKGSFISLGNNLVPTIFSVMALAGKNAWSKIGAWGLAGFGLYKVVKEGFGIGKNTPIDR